MVPPLRVLTSVATASQVGWSQESSDWFHPVIPRIWDETAMATLEVPLSHPVGSPKYVWSDYYYKIPVRPSRHDSSDPAS